MIYIFDDRTLRRKENEEKLRSFSDIIQLRTLVIESGKSVEECIVDSIDDPECIMFHKSYAFDDSNVSFETIRQLFISLDIPIIVFSGGTENGNKGDKEINMNADVMYRNMPYFLMDFKVNRRINIDSLLWGQKHELNTILNFQNEMSKKYFINNDLDELIGDVDEIKRTILNYRNVSKCIREDIISDLAQTSHLTWQDVNDIINIHIHKLM